MDLQLKAEVEGFSQLLVVKTPAAAQHPDLASLKFKLDTVGLNVCNGEPVLVGNGDWDKFTVTAPGDLNGDNIPDLRLRDNATGDLLRAYGSKGADGNVDPTTWATRRAASRSPPAWSRRPSRPSAPRATSRATSSPTCGPSAPTGSSPPSPEPAPRSP
ncbi:hypothetical protein [Streptomyces sp. XY332]|uniref:hypothetical protein n=1 Tax=Streptomyces sp. XY332 TaxID=1415561 RepID=UPI0006B22173|nr:hypothetical protein [Streptomyces sp. XY332]KOY56719.1 hypothetical protein ADK59_18380 [Streptomyces sp. XY332]